MSPDWLGSEESADEWDNTSDIGSDEDQVDPHVVSEVTDSPSHFTSPPQDVYLRHERAHTIIGFFSPCQSDDNYEAEKRMTLLSKTLTNPQVAAVKVGALLLSPAKTQHRVSKSIVCPLMAFTSQALSKHWY